MVVTFLLAHREDTFAFWLFVVPTPHRNLLRIKDRREEIRNPLQEFLITEVGRVESRFRTAFAWERNLHGFGGRTVIGSRIEALEAHLLGIGHVHWVELQAGALHGDVGNTGTSCLVAEPRHREET